MSARARSGPAPKRLVILGGGAGGLELASLLAARDDLDVTLVDREFGHVWKPRLHELGAGTVSSSLADLSFYMLAHLRGFRFEQGEVTALDRERREVRLGSIHVAGATVEMPERRLGYDLCVVALGGQTPAPLPGVEEHAIRLDRKSDADALRARFVAAMVAARDTGRPAEVVIVGTGATGTELAAHLRRSERGFFEKRDRRERDLLRITLLEAAPELMPGAEPDLRRELAERLARLKITVRTNAKVSAIQEGAVIGGEGGERWPATIAVWAAGSAGLPLLERLGGFDLDAKGRIRVDPTLQALGDDHVFALGDASSFTPRGGEKPLPPTAQVASQQAVYLSQTLPYAARGEPAEPFRYDNKGKIVSLAGAGTIGKLAFGRRDDILIGGRFALAAYHGLERQHQWRILGPWHGTVSIATDLLSPTKGPALKLYGDD